MTLTDILIVYFLAINLVAFAAYGVDKYKARHSRWRTPERTLLGLAVVGGSLGAWAGMRLWHHKTQHRLFRYGVPAILAIQAALAIYLIIRHYQ